MTLAAARTDWESMMPATGLGQRPARSRMARRSSSRIRLKTPALAQRLKKQKTVLKRRKIRR
ncbi:hypothetical protein ACFQ0B_78790 [Nonomuraea thailandensis]